MADLVLEIQLHHARRARPTQVNSSLLQDDGVVLVLS